jgi:REP element-mobilizing transposase RayT
LLVKILDEVRDRHGFTLAGYVVMPNHIHLLISEAAQGTPSSALQVLKQSVSRRSVANHGKKHSPNNSDFHFGKRTTSYPDSGSPASTILMSGARRNSLRNSTTCT